MNLYENNLYDVPLITGIKNDKKKILYKAYVYTAIYQMSKQLNVEVDIQKTSLLVNSGFFECHYLRYCKSMNSAYKTLYNLASYGEALYRLFLFDDETMNSYEEQHMKDLQKRFADYCHQSLCHTCKNYSVNHFTMGMIQCCNAIKRWKFVKPDDLDNVKKCKKYIQADVQIQDIAFIPKEIDYINVEQELDFIDTLSYITISKSELIKNIKVLDLFLALLDNCPDGYKVEINKAIHWAIKNYKNNKKIPNYFYYKPELKKWYRTTQLPFVRGLRK